MFPPQVVVIRRNAQSNDVTANKMVGFAVEIVYIHCMNVITSEKTCIRRRLQQASTVTSGFHFRGSVVNVPTGNYVVIQMKNITSDHTGIHLSTHGLVRTSDRGFQEQHFARSGDILFCSRGHNNFALHLMNPPERAVVPGQFFIVRPDRSVISSEYLAWYLNHPMTQRLIAAIRGGTGTPIVTSMALAELEITLPDHATQKRISEVYALQTRERGLICRIQELRDATIDTNLLNIAEGKLQ